MGTRIRRKPFSVNPSLTAKRSPSPAGPRPLRSGGFDKGRRLIRLPAIGLPLGMPAPARYEPPRGFPCQIRRGPGRFESNRGPHRTSLVAPADRRWRRRCGSASESSGVRAVLAARAARRAALKPYRNFAPMGHRWDSWLGQLIRAASGYVCPVGDVTWPLIVGVTPDDVPVDHAGLRAATVGMLERAQIPILSQGRAAKAPPWTGSLVPEPGM